MGAMKVQQTFEGLSSEILIKKLFSIDPMNPYPGIALEVLSKRQEKKAVPALIKLTKSLHPYMRTHAIRTLGQIGDVRAIPRLVEIIEKGKRDKNYSDALYSLSQLGYEPARPYVLKLLKKERGLRKGAIGMIKYIGKQGDIPLLEEMYKNIQDDDVNARLEKKGLKFAIEAIKQREQ